jgi:hypothetical protein
MVRPTIVLCSEIHRATSKDMISDEVQAEVGSSTFVYTYFPDS